MSLANHNDSLAKIYTISKSTKNIMENILLCILLSLYFDYMFILYINTLHIPKSVNVPYQNTYLRINFADKDCYTLI